MSALITLIFCKFGATKKGFLLTHLRPFCLLNYFLAEAVPRKKHKKDKRKSEEDIGNVCMCSALTKQSGYNRL